MTHKYQLLFFLKKQKANNKTGKCPIYLRISCDKRTEISLNLKVHADKWNPYKQSVNGNSPEGKAINDILKTVTVRFHEIHRQLLDKGDPISAEGLKNRFLGIGPSQKTVMQVFDYHQGQIAAKLGKGYSRATLKKYDYLRSHFIGFLRTRSGGDDILLSKVDLFMIKEFQAYLLTDRHGKDQTGKVVLHKGCEHNTALKYIKNFRTIIKLAHSLRWIDYDPFTGFKEKFQDVDQEFLNESELKQIINKPIDNERLSVIRDLFVFCCFTGLAYSDVAKLSSDHIVVGINGGRMIDLKRTKTKTECKIPLLPIPEAILKKYATQPGCVYSGKLLPVPSNQKLNAYLKEIAGICSLEKNLTTHVARRTFATVAADLNIPAETIVLVIGHKTFKHLHLYSKPGQAKISKDMEAFINKDWGTTYEVALSEAAVNGAS